LLGSQSKGIDNAQPIPDLNSRVFASGCSSTSNGLGDEKWLSGPDPLSSTEFEQRLLRRSEIAEVDHRCAMYSAP